MSNNNSLESLWQQQQVSAVDIKRLQQQWRVMRLKQWLYVVLDAFGVLMVPVLLMVLPRKLHPFEMLWLGSVFALLVLLFLYLLWLRRFSIGFRNAAASTSDYLEKVKRQYRQNIRIAKLNQALSFYTPLLFLSYLVIAYVGEFLPEDTLWRKTKLLLLVCVILCPLGWMWAHKRVQKFNRLLADLDKQSCF